MKEATVKVRLEKGQELTDDLLRHIAKVALEGTTKVSGFGTGTGIVVSIERNKLSTVQKL